MAEMLEPVQPEASGSDFGASVAEGVGRVTLLDALSEPAVFTGADMSNRSTPPVNTDFDDQ